MQSIVLAAIVILLLTPATGWAQSIYEDFNQFCRDTFGAEHEPLVYERYGNDLQFVDTGSWIHESRNSAAIAFETNLPATTYVEYGSTDSYGQTTISTDREYYLHLHHLTGLNPDQIIHYELVATDERGNIVRSGDRVLLTHSLPAAIPVPGSLSGPPYVLNQANAYYLLTEDVISDTRGVSIKASNITLDLNGHTITYDEGTPLVLGEWNNYLYSDISTSGVHLYFNNPQGTFTLRNGVIRQGRNNGQGHISVGFNPILLSGGMADIAGVVADYSGHSVGGIDSHWGPLNAHHNVILDRGTGIDSRHMGIKAIFCATVGPDGLHHNLVKRARQQGLMHNGGGPIRENEIYLDSYDTNSFGIKPVSLVEANRVFGTGYHVVAVSWVSGTAVRDNLVHLQGVQPTNRSDESGTHSSVNGFRLTQYSGSTNLYENNLYEDNTIVVKAREGCSIARGVQFFSDPYVHNLRFRNNTIKVEVQDGVTPAVACVVGHGLTDRTDQQLPVWYENNTFMTNSLFVRFGDSYAAGGNHRFLGNTFVRQGTHPGHHDLQLGYWIYNSVGNRFIDTICEGGASLEDNLFEGTGRRDYSVGHSLHVIAESAAGGAIATDSLRVSDNTGINYRVLTGAGGDARLELLEYAYVAAQGAPQATRISHTGHVLQIDGFEPYPVSPELFAISNNEADPVTVVFTPLGTPPDTTPPSSVTNLAVSSTTQTAAVLTWTTVGDDGNSGTATTYDLRYSTAAINAGNWGSATQVTGEPAPMAAGQAETFTVTGLTAGTTYHFALKVADEVPNWSGLSNVPSAATQPPPDTTPPSSITNLAVSSTTQTTAVLTWTAVGDDGNSGTATTYDLRYSTTVINAGNWGSATQVTGEPGPKAAGQAETFTVTGLTAGTTYHFALKVADEVPNWSGLSNVPSGTTQAEPPPPPPPGDTTPPSGVNTLAVTSTTQTTAVLTWTAVGDDGGSGTATGYDLRYATTEIKTSSWDAATRVTGEPAPKAAGQPETFTVTGLTAGTTYYFALKVADEVPNWSPLSNIPSGTTEEEPPPPPPADTTPPAAVTNLTADAHTQTSVHLTWTAVGDDGGAGTAATYDLRYAQTEITLANWHQAVSVEGEPEPAVSGEAEEMSVGGLSPGTTYFFALKVGDEVPNWSGLSNVASRQTSSPPPPPPPADQVPPSRIDDLEITSIDVASVRLVWTAPGDDGETGTASTYDLRYAEAPIEPATWENAQQVRNVTGPRPSGQRDSLTVAGLSSGTTYYFALKAADEVPNWSELSNVVSGTTTEPPPPPPPSDSVPPARIDLTSTGRGETWIVLSWSAPGDDGSTGQAQSYQLRYRAGLAIASEEDWQASIPVVAGLPDPEVAGTTQVFTVSSLVAGTTYGFALRALDEAGNLGALGAPFTATTQSPPPPPPPPADLTPPAAVTDLSAVGSGETTVQLSWTAPGDDGTTGTATSYDLRFSTVMINATNWSAAMPAAGLLSPKPAGETEGLALTGLQPGTTYFFALKTADEVPNWSALSNVASGTTTSPPPPPPPPPPADTTPPAAISDLMVVTTGETSIELSWTAPGDDGTTGTATSYDLRYSTSRLNRENWDRATPATTEPAPLPAGQSQRCTVTGLLSGTSYFFALKSADEVPNGSEISNVTTATTQSPPPPPPPPPVDTTPPAAIDDLAAPAFTDSTVTLAWTAPGDDGEEGQATSYLVRHVIGSLLDRESAWEQAVAATQAIPLPRPAGEVEGYTVRGLESGVAYGFAVRAMDEKGNLGPLGRSVLVTTGHEAPPVLSPAAVTELRVVKVEARMAWLALRHPQNPEGIVTTHYEARLRAGGIDSTSWATAGLVEAPDPGAPGEETEWTVTGLTPSTTYFLALRAFGLADRASSLSPALEIRTPAEDLAPPDPPGPPQASWSVDGARVTLQWSPSTDPRVTGYLLYAQGPSTGWFRLREETLASPEVELDRPDPKIVRRLAVRARTEAGIESALSPSLDLYAHEWQLEGPFPHPITDRCRFVISVPADFPEGTRLRVEILSLRGEREALLHDGVVFPGSSVEVFWDRRTTSGQLAAPGFHYVLCTGNGRRTMRTVYVGP